MNDHPLKAHLFEAYGGFADRRIKDPNKSDLFIVDDRSRQDVSSKGGLYSYFCLIFARVLSPDTVRAELTGNIPSGKAIFAWAARHGIAFGENQATLSFSIPMGEEAKLDELALALRSIVRPGAPRYEVSNYKHVCPRTADSLERLAGVLRSFPRPD